MKVMPQGVPKESTTCPECGEDFLRLDAHFRGLTTCDSPDGFFDDDPYSTDDTHVDVFRAGWEADKRLADAGRL